MQIKSLHKNIYKLYSYARTQECLDAYRAKHQMRVNRWKAAKAEGLNDAACQRLSGISRASYYRAKKRLTEINDGRIPPSKARKHQTKPRWGEAERQLVLKVRRENPSYGKEKIARILSRDYRKTFSVSTIGRILKALSQKGLVTRSISAPRPKRNRCFGKGHATPWFYKDYNEMVLGERVQIDHMTVTINGVTAKHFQAWERHSKHITAKIFSNATSRSAKKFLQDLITNAPYKIRSLQVDGGSEFMADFEEECKNQGISLIVLPPSRPKYNGGVERSNRTFKEEFYYKSNILADSIGEWRYELTKAVNKYNEFRPHRALKNLTLSSILTRNPIGLSLSLILPEPIQVLISKCAIGVFL